MVKDQQNPKCPSLSQSVGDPFSYSMGPGPHHRNPLSQFLPPFPPVEARKARPQRRVKNDTTTPGLANDTGVLGGCINDGGKKKLAIAAVSH